MHEIAVPPRSSAVFHELTRPSDLRRYERAVAGAVAGLDGHTWWHVNSTADGGGVAELLHALLGYPLDAGVRTRWLRGAPGDGGPLGPEERSVYDATLRHELQLLASLVRPGDVVTLHDPQAVGLAPLLGATGAHVIWVCHVGVDTANDLAREAWRFLLGDARAAATTVFTRNAYVWDGLDPSKVAIIPPCIDATSPKNVPIEHATVAAVLAAAGVLEAPSGDPTVPLADGSSIRVGRAAEMVERAPVPATTPLVVQVSRWDRLKDPVGVLTGFAAGVPHELDAHLLLAGPQVETVSDDPEGAEVLAEVTAAWSALPAEERERTHLASLPVDDLVENAVMVNALQRRADIVVQKSLAEGFGLTVTEAMWKERPVVGSRVGGIAEQIRHGRSGLLVDPRNLPAFGKALTTLLRDEPLAVEIGHAARRRVRSRFLAPHFLAAHLELALRVAGVADP